MAPISIPWYFKQCRNINPYGVSKIIRKISGCTQMVWNKAKVFMQPQSAYRNSGMIDTARHSVEMKNLQISVTSYWPTCRGPPPWSIFVHPTFFLRIVPKCTKTFKNMNKVKKKAKKKFFSPYMTKKNLEKFSTKNFFCQKWNFFFFSEGKSILKHFLLLSFFRYLP